MRYVLVLALLGVLELPASVPAQYYPLPPRRAYPDEPEALVRQWYRRFLNREVDRGGLAAWTNSLLSGNSPEMTLATILGSPEYYRKCGSTPEGFVQTLYLDIVGREPTDREFQYWLRRMYYDERTDIAYALLRRYPQSWQTVSSPREDPGDWRYDYRRPIWRYRR